MYVRRCQLVTIPSGLLLQRDVDKRLGCRGSGADELKEHPFFSKIDWIAAYHQKYTPPLVPPRGEVNAADAFDIGSFDEEDTKGKDDDGEWEKCLLCAKGGPGQSGRKAPNYQRNIDVFKACVGNLVCNVELDR